MNILTRQNIEVIEYLNTLEFYKCIIYQKFYAQNDCLKFKKLFLNSKNILKDQILRK